MILILVNDCHTENAQQTGNVHDICAVHVFNLIDMRMNLKKKTHVLKIALIM